MMEEKMFLPSFQYHQVLEKQLIRQSAYYRIYKGDYQSEEVVLKVLEDIDEEDVKREASFLSKLIHPNIVQLKAPLRVSVLKKEVLCLNIWHLILKSME